MVQYLRSCPVPTKGLPLGGPAVKMAGGQLLWQAIAITQIEWRKKALVKDPGFWQVGAECTTADTRPDGQRARMIAQVVAAWRELAVEAGYSAKLRAIVPWHDDYISLRWTDQRKVPLHKRIPYWLSLELPVTDQIIQSWITPKLAKKLAAQLCPGAELAELLEILKDYEKLDADPPDADEEE